MGRLWRKQNKLEARLGENCQKPKWMRKRTYERIWTQINDLEERQVACWTGIMRIMRRSGMTLADLY
jgi:hypothetical protein